MNRLRLMAEKELCRRSFVDFVRAAWRVVEPGRRFIDGRHIRELCRHLQHWVTCDAGARDAITDLLVNVPPGHSKSLLVNVFLPAWVWGPLRRLETRWMFASFSKELVGRDAGRRRDLMLSTWYQVRWPFAWKSDQKRRFRYENDSFGWMYATTLPKGQATGEHPDFVCIDDAHNTTTDQNAGQLAAVRDWWSKAIITRGMTRAVRKCVIGQRVAHLDLAGMLIDAGGWTHICLPLRFDPAVAERLRVKATPLGLLDWRTKPGALLWPEGITEAKIREISAAMSPDTESSQLQQLPPEQAGGASWPALYFEGDDLWFSNWPGPTEVQFTVIALDPSMGKTETSDYQSWCILKLHSDGRMFVDATIRRAPVSELADITIELMQRHNPLSVVIEGNGFQEVLEPYFQQTARLRGIHIPISLVYHSTQKRARVLRCLSAPLKERLYRYRSGSPGAALLFEQLRTFQGVYDDGPDSLEMATAEARRIWTGGDV